MRFQTASKSAGLTGGASLLADPEVIDYENITKATRESGGEGGKKNKGHGEACPLAVGARSCAARYALTADDFSVSAWARAEVTSLFLQGEAIRSTAPWRKASRYSSQ